MSPRIILIGGIPATGKTTLAKEISINLGVPFFNKDMLESTLIGKNICSINELNGIGYTLMERIALSELELGRSVILDCIAPLKRVDKYWNSFKTQDIRYIECICSDQKIHRTRLESRKRHIPDWYELTWNDVKNITKSYEPCFETKLNLDSVNPFKDNLEKAIRYVSS